jgi:hypothetical protein
VNVAVAWLIPVAKLNPQFECRAGLAHELRLVDSEHVVEGLDVRQRSLTDADSSDLIGFNKRNGVIVGPNLTPDAGGAHPAGRTASHDYHAERR